MTVNQRIRKVREELNLSQAAFGKMINISQSQIASYETGYRKITDRTIKDICREFNVNEDWLISGNGDMFNSLTDDEEFAFLMGQITADDNPLLKNLIKVLSQINNEDDLDAILSIARRLANKTED